MSNILYLRDKKDEYLYKLEKITTRLYFQGIKAIYSVTQDNNKVHKNLLKEFQRNLKEITQWDQDDIISEYARFKEVSQFDSLDKLIHSIFKIFVLMYNPKKESSFKYPAGHEYMYQCYLSIARKIWKEPYLFYDQKLSKTEIQRNFIRIEKIIKKSIRETFSQMLPFEDDDLNEDLEKQGDDELQSEEESEGHDNEEDEDESEGDEEDDEDESEGDESEEDDEDESEGDESEEDDEDESEEDNEDDSEDDDNEEEDEEGDEDESEEEDDDNEEGDEEDESDEEDDDNEEGDEEDESEEDEGDEEEEDESDEDEDDNEGEEEKESEEDEDDDDNKGVKTEASEIKQESEGICVIKKDEKSEGVEKEPLRKTEDTIKVIKIIDKPKQNKKEMSLLEKKRLIKKKLLSNASGNRAHDSFF